MMLLQTERQIGAKDGSKLPNFPKKTHENEKNLDCSMHVGPLGTFTQVNTLPILSS